MPGFVDVINQVQKVMPVRFGGSGNEEGFAKERLVLPYMNDTGGALAIGTLVKLSGSHDDRRVTPTTTIYEQTSIGVVVGRFRTGTNDEAWGNFEAVAPAHQETVAVCVQGRCTALVAAAVNRGDFAYPSNTDGQLEGSSIAVTGVIGIFETSTSGAGSAAVRMTGSSAGSPQQFFTINYIFSAGGSATPQIGTNGVISVDAAGTIVAARMLTRGDSGSAVVDIEKATYSGFPTTSSICGSAKPTLSAAAKSEDTTLSGWTTAIAAGDVLLYQLDSISGLAVVTCSLKVRRA